MAFEINVGLLVTDDTCYARYREEMSPLLEAAGGSFRYDFDVAYTLKREAAHDINRVFVIHFPDRASKETFFANAEYLKVRERLFAPSVEAATIIAEYEC